MTDTKYNEIKDIGIIPPLKRMSEFIPKKHFPNLKFIPTFAG